MLAACDMAVVVAEADEKKIPALQLIMRKLDEIGIPRILFLNKIDKTAAGVRDTLKLLQPTSAAPLLLRQIPLRKDGVVIGSIDLALERAYVYREYAESEVTEIPGDEKAREIEARFSMLETLADHDDQLMEQLLDEIEPPRDAVFDDLAADLRAGAVTPVLIGTADKGNGVLRLLKAIRHDAPDIEATSGAARRQGRQRHAGAGHEDHPHLAWRQAVDRRASCPAAVADGLELASSNGGSGKVSGIYRMLGKDQSKLTSAKAGETVALGKLDDVRTGDTLGSGKGARRSACRAGAAAIRCSPSRCGPRSARTRSSCRPPSSGLSRRTPRSACSTSRIPARRVLSGHGEMHLRVIIERLEGRNQIPVERHAPAVPYRETIRKTVTAARPPQEAVGRPRPVRRRRDRHQAAAARLRLPVHRNRHRRRGAEDTTSPRSRQACAIS